MGDGAEPLCGRGGAFGPLADDGVVTGGEPAHREVAGTVDVHADRAVEEQRHRGARRVAGDGAREGERGRSRGLDRRDVLGRGGGNLGHRGSGVGGDLGSRSRVRAPVPPSVGAVVTWLTGVDTEVSVPDAASIRLVPPGPEEPPAVSAATLTATAATSASAPPPCSSRRRRPSSWARAATSARSRSPGSGGCGSLRSEEVRFGISVAPARSCCRHRCRRRPSTYGGLRGPGWRAASPIRPSNRGPWPPRLREGRRGIAAR